VIYIGDHTRITGRHIDGDSVSADISRPVTRAIAALDLSARSPGHMQDATLALPLQDTQESTLLPQWCSDARQRAILMHRRRRARTDVDQQAHLMYCMSRSQCATRRACSELVQNLLDSAASLGCCRTSDTAAHTMWPQGPHKLALPCECSRCFIEFVWRATLQSEEEADAFERQRLTRHDMMMTLVLCCFPAEAMPALLLHGWVQGSRMPRHQRTAVRVGSLALSCAHLRRRSTACSSRAKGSLAHWQRAASDADSDAGRKFGMELT